MPVELQFSLEIVNGDRLGKLTIPFSQMANWLNLLTSPHYNIQIVHTEQGRDAITIYFDACEAVYWYVGDRVCEVAPGEGCKEVREAQPVLLPLAR